MSNYVAFSFAIWQDLRNSVGFPGFLSARDGRCCRLTCFILPLTEMGIHGPLFLLVHPHFLPSQLGRLTQRLFLCLMPMRFISARSTLSSPISCLAQSGSTVEGERLVVSFSAATLNVASPGGMQPHTRRYQCPSFCMSCGKRQLLT